MPDSHKITKAEIQEAHTNYEAPDLVVADPTLSKVQKDKLLDNLEQDARQMSDAANEGMGGGEPAALSEVLDAKQSLTLPPTAFAYELVLKDLRARSYQNPEMVALSTQTIVALETLQNAAT
jgi:hypothetical protein